MRVRQLLLVLVLSMAGALGTANAALLGNVCTFAGGCGPDFAVIGANANYVYNGAGGTLTINGTAGNASFLPGQLDPWPDASEMQGFLAGTDPDISIPVSITTTLGSNNDNFSMIMTVDGAGNLLSGSISMNGRVNQFFSSTTTTNPLFQTGQLYTAAANGISLDGELIAAGSTITSMGFNASSIDFFATLDSGSLLSTAGFGTNGMGIIGFTNFQQTTNINWGTDWSATATLDVVVPLPAAFWLFLSGIAVLFSTSRSRLMRS